MRSRGKPRKPGLTRKAKERDGYICQCCGRPGSDGHHIHPLAYGGPDELNNVITLCELCHKHSPDNPAEFLAYQKEGGQFMRQFRAEWRAEYALNVIKDAARNGDAIPNDELIEKQFEDSFQNIRANLYGSVPTEALNLGLPGFVKQFESRDKGVNDSILVEDKEIAEMRIAFFKQFIGSDFAFAKANKLASHIINIKDLREKYGYTAEVQEQIRIETEKKQATQELTYKPPYMNCELRYVHNYASCAKTWHELIQIHLGQIIESRKAIKQLQPLIQKGTLESFNEAYKITCELDLLASNAFKKDRWLWISVTYSMAVSKRLHAIDDLRNLDAYLQSKGGCIKYASEPVPDKLIAHAQRRRERYGDKADENARALFRKAFDWSKSKLKHLYPEEPKEAETTERQLTLAI